MILIPLGGLSLSPIGFHSVLAKLLPIVRHAPASGSLATAPASRFLSNARSIGPAATDRTLAAEFLSARP